MATYIAILIDQFIASGGPFLRHLVGAAAARCIGAAVARCKLAGGCFRGEGSDDARQAGSRRHNKRVVVLAAEDGVHLHARRAGGGRHDKSGGAEGAERGEREADDTTRGGRGQTTRGKRAADDTTRGLSLRRQKMADTCMRGGQAADDMTRGGGGRGRSKVSGKRTPR